MNSHIQDILALVDSFDGKGKLALPAGTLTLPDTTTLLARLREDDLGVAYFDSHYPELTDPGAYFSCVPHINATWRMTLGNHGWTGGIYTMPDSLLSLQLTRSSELFVGEVAFFSKYPEQTAEKNSAECAKIRALHS